MQAGAGMAAGAAAALGRRPAEAGSAGSRTQQEDLERGSAGTTSSSVTDGAASSDTRGVDLIELTHDWLGLGNSSPSGVAQPDVDRHARYKNMAEAIEAAEQGFQRHLMGDAYGLSFQALVGFLICFAVNLRLFDALVILFDLRCDVFHVCCGCAEGGCDGMTMSEMVTFMVLGVMNLFLIIFQTAIAARDRYLRTLRNRYWESGNYFAHSALMFYICVVLGVFSGWPVLRSIRQLRNPAYRDSFLAELNDPGMVSHAACRMPFYSSHLTFIFEAPFLFRVVHGFLRQYIYWQIGVWFWTGWLLCFMLFCVAVVTFDYSVSDYIRKQYSSEQMGFRIKHWVYRVCESLLRFLSVGTTMLTFPELELWVLLALDYVVGLMALCVASKRLSKRVLFVSLPMFCTNLTLFVDGPGVVEGARLVSLAVDAVRLAVVGVGFAGHYRYLQAVQSGDIVGNAMLATRVGVCLLVMGVCALTCLFLRLDFAARHAVGPRQGAGAAGAGAADADAAERRPRRGTRDAKARSKARSETSAEPAEDATEPRDLFGQPLDATIHCQSRGNDEDLASLLFAKGIGDQLASLMEIFWERDEGIRLSRLEVLGRLGAGAFGTVLEVRDSRSGTPYALKLQRQSSATAHAVREAEFLHGVHHPYIVGLHRIFRTTEFYCILLELCEPDLNKVIVQHVGEGGVPKGLPLAEAQHYAACMALALQHLHHRCIVFRDLKPENVLTTAKESDPHGQSHAKLADFGLAKSVSSQVAAVEDEDDNPATSAQTARCGTPAFMPTEAFSSEVGLVSNNPVHNLQLLTSRDWYAYGCCLLLMLLGARGALRSTRPSVLLPPAAEGIPATLRTHAAELGVAALDLVGALTAGVSAERAGFEEVRTSPLLCDAVRAAERRFDSAGAAAAGAAG